MLFIKQETLHVQQDLIPTFSFERKNIVFLESQKLKATTTVTTELKKIINYWSQWTRKQLIYSQMKSEMLYQKRIDLEVSPINREENRNKPKI